MHTGQQEQCWGIFGDSYFKKNAFSFGVATCVPLHDLDIYCRTMLTYKPHLEIIIKLRRLILRKMQIADPSGQQDSHIKKKKK